MSKARTEQRLFEVGRRLEGVRSELAIAEEQFDHLSDSSEEARLRALVSETPLADREFRDADRHTEAMRRHRDDLVGSIAELEKLQDQLLDDYTANPS